MAQSLLTVPDPGGFDELPADRVAGWSRFGSWDRAYFPSLVGLELEEVRDGYTRMRLPYRPELEQPAGVVHGGALATLVDTVVVPAVGAHYEQVPIMLTLSMDLQFLGAVREEDAVAHGWVVRRGRSIVFCEAVVLTASGQPAVSASLVYRVSQPR